MLIDFKSVRIFLDVTLEPRTTSKIKSILHLGSVRSGIVKGDSEGPEIEKLPQVGDQQ